MAENIALPTPGQIYAQKDNHYTVRIIGADEHEIEYAFDDSRKRYVMDKARWDEVIRKGTISLMPIAP